MLRLIENREKIKNVSVERQLDIGSDQYFVESKLKINTTKKERIKVT